VVENSESKIPTLLLQILVVVCYQALSTDGHLRF